MLNLMVMRHGKSNWDADTPIDHDRPIASRGIASAERMGLVIHELGIVPDLVLSSTAARARSTAELARLSGGWNSRLVLVDDLYGCSVDEALVVVEQFGEHHERIMIVGHQPTWSMLVQRLTGSRCAMRTATVADIEIHAPDWAALLGGTGTLVSLLQPRSFVGP